MTQINPYLLFGGNCREAMNFYADCLGGELTMQTMGESPMGKDMPQEMKDNIMHASLSKNGILLLMASDMMGKEEVKQGNTISLSLNCGSEDEINMFFSKLSAGGQVTQPLEDAFWGAKFGMLIDKFGMHWMLNFDKSKA